MGILDPLFDYKLRAFENIKAPVLKTPVIDGNPGTATVEYCATFQTINGETEAGPVASITNAPNTLNGFNRVKIEIGDVPAAANVVRFFKKVATEFHLLGEATPEAPALWDQGQTPDATKNPPAENTSGRSNYLALLPRSRKLLQRAEVADLQAMLLKAIGNVVGTFHKDGDVITGCNEQERGSNVWGFTAGKVALNPFHIDVPAGEVTLTGNGLEKVGLVITPIVITDSDDPHLRNPDKGIDVHTFAMGDGCYRLCVTVEWAVDEPGMLVIREFVDGQPKLAQYQTETTELDRKLARQRFDTSGSFVVKNFPVQILDNTDSTKFDIKILNGKAYPDGYEIETLAPQVLTQPRARETSFRNSAVAGAFTSLGGSVLGTATENFNVDGLNVKIQVGSGAQHTVALSGTGQTAAQVATQIANALNAVPTAPNTLVSCQGVGGKLQVSATDGRALSILAVASDAYTVLGLTIGTYQPTGQRVYRLAELFVKDVSDLNYPVLIVEAVTHNGTTHIDNLANANVREILGASTTAAKAHDRQFDYQNGVDFGQTGDAIDFTLYGGSDPSNGATYYVAYEYNYNAVRGSRELVRVTDAQVVKGAEDGADSLVVTGGTWTKELDGSAVTGLSGSVTDAHAILRVNNTPGQSQSQYSSYSLQKNSDALAHATSKIDWSAAGTQGQTGSGQPTTGATYYVTFTYWRHTVEGDFVAANSYDLYSEIEMAPNQTWPLRDCIDFRTTGIMPRPTENPILDYNFYLGRIDKIVLKGDGTFYAITGTPAKAPQEPPNPTGGLVVAKLIVGPYTYSTRQVSVVPVQALRRTQMGIQELAEEIQKLQYYQSINNLERAAAENANAAAIEAKGIFVDPLTGTGRCDFQFNKNGVEFTAAIDSERQVMKLPVNQDARHLIVDELNSTNIQRVGRTICFAFEEEDYISQLRSTECMAVNPYEFYAWDGILRIDPEQDVFTDIEQLPAVDVNYDDNMLAMLAIEAANAEKAHKITWGSWHLAADSVIDRNQVWLDRFLQENDPNHWVAEGEVPSYMRGIDPASVSDTFYATGTIRERTGTRTSIVPQRTLVDLGDKVIDRTVVPMMRTKLQGGADFEVDCIATSMWPEGTYALTINGILVDFTATGTYQQGTDYQGKDTVVADASGRLTGKFKMPPGIPTGTATVRCFLANDPLTSSASATFFSQGYRELHQRSVMGVVSSVERLEIVSAERQVRWVDPLAETFLVSEGDGTVYISSVDLYVCKKDAHIPLTVEIRTTLNGYPTQTVLQTRTLMPSEINADETGGTRTRFTFDNVVGYNAGEYAIALISNCNSYWVRVCEVGKLANEDGRPVLSQPYGGVLFGSPNGSTWVAMPTYDLKFQINKSNFQNNCQIVFDKITGIQAGMLCAKVTQFLPVGTSLRWSYSLDEGDTWIPFAPLIDTSLLTIATEIDLLVDVTSVGGTFLIIDRVAGILFLLHDSAANYVSANALFTDTPDKVCMYLPVNADGVNGVGARTITPYYSRDNGEKWIEIKPPAGYVPIALGDGTFQEYRFETPGEATVTGATNATPIVIASENHGFQENEVVFIAAVGGTTNANGTRLIKNVTDDTFELYNPDTEAAIAGNGAYTSGGTIRVAPMTQGRYRIHLATANQAISPEVGAPKTIFGVAAA